MMDTALSLLLLWGLLFVPIGLVLHWLVLGDGACVRALPIAPVTGVATAFLVLSGLGRLGIDAGTAWVAWSFVIASAASAVLIWRVGVPWRSRELIGSTALLVFAVLLLQLPVLGADKEGPLGYGTAADPVQEVAAIDAAADGPAAKLEVARRAADSASERPIAFEQFAALTVAIGRSEDTKATDTTWSAYNLHSALTGMLAVLAALPLFAFARARGVGAFGLIVLIPLGVLTPYGFLALANGSGAAIASVPFLIAGAFSLLVTRRDRGWWALAVLFGSAAVATAGVLALLPLVTTGFAWMFLRSNTYEHLSQHDAPVARARTLTVTSVAAILGGLSIVTTLADGGSLLAWPQLHGTLLDTLRSWPFSWLDTDLSAIGPVGAVETVVWLIGPLLLVVASIEAVIRNERRELGVMAGAFLAFCVGAITAVFDRDAGIRLIEFVLLACSPLLASLAVRGVSLARETSDSVAQSRLRFVRSGPALVVAAFVLLSISATAVTGSRMVHAPALASAEAATANGSTLIAGGDPWLAFVIDGERVRGGYADADELAGTDPSAASRSITFGDTSYDQLVLSSSPLASDPPLRWYENSTLDAYQVRAFRDRSSDESVRRDLDVDDERIRQRTRSAAANVETESTDEEGTKPKLTARFQFPQVHDPVETESVPADRPAGLLLPERDVDGCSTKNPALDQSTCDPAKPQLGDGCTQRDLQAVRSPIDKAASSTRAGERDERTQLLRLDSDVTQQDQPGLIGVQCFDVELREETSVLLLHVRDIGHILAPEQATSVGTRGAWSREDEADRVGGVGGVAGGVRRVTNERGAALRYGSGRLFGRYELTFEGAFGAGVELSTASTTATVDGEGNEQPDEPVAFSELRGSADGFSSLLRDVELSGQVTVSNRAGTDIALGRAFARPRDLPRSCDYALPAEEGARRELRIEGTAAGADAIERPGVSTAIVGIEERDGARIARVAVGSYLSDMGLPRYQLIDWTEQYDSPVEVDGCDGVVQTETGVDSIDKLESFGRANGVEVTIG